MNANPQTSDVEMLPTQSGALVLNPMQLLEQAIARGATVEIVERLMALVERWQAHRARQAFDTAIAKASANMPILKKNRSVGFEAKGGKVGYKHEDLAEIIKTIKPILSAEGLSARFRTTKTIPGEITVTCIISHCEGHFEENTLSGPVDTSGSKNPLQAIGSTATYLQRYTLKPALGLAASDDDDGRASGKPIIDGNANAVQAADEPAISAEQVKEMMALIKEHGVTTTVFCKHYGIKSVAQLPLSLRDDAIQACRNYKTKKAAETADKKAAQ